MPEYEHHSLDQFKINPDKPGLRWELSPQLEIDAYNFNVAVLEPGKHLSENGYHYHENQREFFYVVDGRAQLEAPDGAFTAATDEVVLFDEGVTHLLHNPFAEAVKLIAVGDPPEGRYPVHQVAPADELLMDRYGTTEPTPETDESY